MRLYDGDNDIVTTLGFFSFFLFAEIPFPEFLLNGRNLISAKFIKLKNTYDHPYPDIEKIYNVFMHHGVN